MTCSRLFLAMCAGCVLGGSFATGQVFTPDPGAVDGYTPMGTGQALYGGFGLDSANDPEFKVYRKFLERDEEAPLSSASNVEGNPGEALWVNVNQRQATSEGLQAPGMFIGQKTHVTEDGWVVSNPNQLLYFRELIDTDEDQTAIADSNRNAFWDTRFGFMEDPDAFVDFVEPNSEQLDLWTGQFNTDAVYAQTSILRDDSQANTNVTTTQGHGGSFKLMAGAPDTEIANESERDSYELMRTQAGTGEELTRSGQIDAGVSYSDPIEVSWGMRLANPESTDAIDGRLVEFFVKTGNIISSGVFDPGNEDSLPLDPPNFNDFVDYTDGWFDWQSAKPVFFAGAQALVGGEGAMGMFIPGDFGADGSVDLDDFNRLAGDYGAAGTTYSRGDLNQDGVTDEADAAAWAELASDGVKTQALAAVQTDLGGSLYDFDGSGTTGDEDVAFIRDLLGVTDTCVNSQGDIDGNGTVEFADFLVLSANFGTAGGAAQGDIDCDGQIAFSDFLALSANFGTQVGQAQSVPEPSGMLMFAFAVLALNARRRQRVD